MAKGAKLTPRKSVSTGKTVVPASKSVATKAVIMSGKGARGPSGQPKRIRMKKFGAIQGISKCAIRRLARRGGCRRVSGLIYEETRGVLKFFLERVIKDSLVYMEHARRKTLSAKDVVYALKHQGKTIYGFG
jgi:histone H4